jgi:hypothetical protein
MALEVSGFGFAEFERREIECSLEYNTFSDAMLEDFTKLFNKNLCLIVRLYR